MPLALANIVYPEAALNYATADLEADGLLMVDPDNRGGLVADGFTVFWDEDDPEDPDADFPNFPAINRSCGV